MTKDDAIRAAKQIGMSKGEIIFVQSNGQITHPHPHSGQKSGPTHTDGWAVKLDWDGQYRAAKIHSDDNVDNVRFS